MSAPVHEVSCPECGTTIRARLADQGEAVALVELRAENARQHRALLVWQQGFQITARAGRAEIDRLTKERDRLNERWHKSLEEGDAQAQRILALVDERDAWRDAYAASKGMTSAELLQMHEAYVKVRKAARG